MAAQLRLSDGHREWRVTVDGAVARIEGVEGEFSVSPSADGRWIIRHAGETHMGSSARTAFELWTGVNAATASWQAENASSRPRHKGSSVDALRAPMNATVVRVHVAAGDTVAEGDALVVVEAMKMEMPIRAPHAGVIRVVYCREGELVSASAVLVELE